MGLRNAMKGEPNVQKELDTVRRDLSRLRSDLGEVVTAVGGMGRQNVTQVREGVSDQLDELNKRYASGRKYCSRQWRQAKRRAREHPLGTTLIAVAGGLIVAAIANVLWLRR
jgi:ElaB/YqjD/DUF883 family membrane-anchored ribosome-binding protein